MDKPRTTSLWVINLFFGGAGTFIRRAIISETIKKRLSVLPIPPRPPGLLSLCNGRFHREGPLAGLRLTADEVSNTNL